ncbi:2-succinyl-6-hydroxy-2,4-cyclohexadiene-1-carboxylate synthase [Listeria cossartiae subsp. cayugensis]|uniref:Putative 2-succinyl-6-hydroxy-2,4-cyclohexadiene-1-carboxylate synthase n=1 Tax=Listeria cossartiae subsp. cayugensis TaxID=2713505 RepID=A0ABU2IIM1_9LIST|nr:2-succinyl-6-hydroxy-2,4-cyclohexadiene-1-carboxylate synthase [Listeria cossartiae]MDT0003297.1 2-succinyl-6-hydroxy-2,4-cyclohexadiene-1-carboxylate synthase [Listeria cossartiae subsp. cayugensis]MDT0018336.1 2-succinyl-6-hydroxy-2,4-cyclohexadiene-1-carboxylate synthase [Listeria cossartiae subsp. cayugensis]MDT0036092.1 2-succinyl-6-hydroxy-2,4-cyclohexadiene-1-carboxylate synthase [Listeria cossartiae subsp. cayugensis]MDT0040086.1 2-succinyl-6-hydroxy-2,4-cyclohexadiene-1-carboxylate 
MLVNGQRYHLTNTLNGDKPVLLMLHGFTGTSETFQDSIAVLKEWYNIIAPDLLGHGKTASPAEMTRYSIEAVCADLAEILNQQHIKQCFVLGYSMGGRVATAFAATYPEMVRGLILVSSSPGLAEADARASRVQADNRLADRIEADGITSFVDYWENLALFASQSVLPEERKKRMRSERLAQNPQGLAMSLRGMGTGKQPSYWNRLADFTFPVLLITGALDEKFEKIAQNMQQLLPNSTHVTVQEAGHAVYLEQPNIFSSQLNNWLEVILKEEEK